MAMYVHFAPQSRVKSILRTGIARVRSFGVNRPGGIFCMPVTPHFYLTHQWLRELRRRGTDNYVAIYFRLPDRETVWFGHYGKPHQQLTAAEAVSALMTIEQPQGFEVIVPRRIASSEICRTRHVPQTVGWRYCPGSHGMRPCGCPMCQRSQYGAKKLRRAYNEQAR